MLLLLREYFQKFQYDAIIFNCGQLIMDTSLVSDNFFGKSRSSPII